MNIFYLHPRTKKCAKYYVDKHVLKILIEVTQLLCTAIWLSGGEAPYKATHKNHPCAIWARASRANWKWLKRLGLALCKEYKYRYGEHKTHKTQLVLEKIKCPDLPKIPFTPPPQAMDDEYKNKNTIVAYRTYYALGKSHIHSWKKRKEPSWLKKYKK